eukprot:s821_g17.t1
MYVKIVPRTEETQYDRVIPFVSHYKKHTGFVQVLEASPRVPYMVGFTMPSRHGDAATNALYHLCLMKPGNMCRGQCDDVGWLSGHVISHSWPRHQQNMFGFTWPTRKASRKRGEGRFTEAWKAWEALQLTRAQQGWRKLKAERRVAVLDDVASFRTWYLPNAVKETVVQSWLLPWLRGHFRHVYKGPWKEKRTGTHVNPKYSRTQFLRLHPLGLACLPALPHSVAVNVLRFAGDVRTEDGQVLIIADDEITQKRQLENFSTPASVLFTGTGVHMHQLFPEEFAATIQAEVSWNMDLLAEARKRPRPNVVSVFEEEGDEALGGTCLKDNVVKFFQNFRGFYDDELKTSKTCFARKTWGFCPADTFAAEVAARNAMLQAQKRLKEAAQKGSMVAESDNELNDEAFVGPAELPKVAFTFLDPDLVPETPAQMARRLACESGAAWDQQQYNMIVLCISPLQQVWDFATQTNRLGEWDLPEGRLTLIRDSGVSPMRIFGHGAGGSGKTFCLTQAAQNSAARLIEGETMHARAGLTKNAKFTLEEPSRKLKDKLKNAWGQAVLVYNDEVGAAAPGLYGTLSSRAYWGKRAAGQVEDVGPQKAPFGDPLLHVDAGDFAQLRPVPRGSPSLMEAFLIDRDEFKKEQRVRPLTDMELLGLKTFDLVATNCVEFQGTYRFKPKDPLLKLLQIMRTVGGAKVPESLRRQALLRSALLHVNMTDTGKLSGFCPLFVGMPVKVTHKLAPPHIVQEATGEVLAIGFHEQEAFGLPKQMQRPGAMPHETHPCWKKGWVKLDLLPRWVEIRFHGCTVDFTQTGRPAVYVVEPTNADWELRYQASKVINHPNEKPVRRRGPRLNVGLRSSQLPLAPAGVGTFNNMQGKTARDEASVPMGHTVDLKLLDSNDDKWLHYYMILGRATCLATTLLLNFPESDDGEPDWTLFESGPPEYLTHVF